MSASALGSRAIIGAFYEKLEAASGQSWINKVSMPFSSDQESETYKWLGQVPVMREWVGGRNAKAFRANGLTITNKTFEATLLVTMDEIRRDKTGQVMVRIGELADRVVTHEASLLSTLILNGGGSTSGLCYDGQFFFDSDHTEGENTASQSNLVTVDISDLGTGGTSTAPTAATMSAGIMKTIAAMLGFLDEQSEPMNEMAKSFVVMVPPSLMASAMGAVVLPMLEAGVSNLIPASGFNIDVQVNPRLASWTDKYAVFRSDGQVKPFITQSEVPLDIAAQAEGSAEEFNNRRHLYGVSKVGNVGYGMWQHAALATMQA